MPRRRGSQAECGPGPSGNGDDRGGRWRETWPATGRPRTRASGAPDPGPGAAIPAAAAPRCRETASRGSCMGRGRRARRPGSHRPRGHAPRVRPADPANGCGRSSGGDVRPADANPMPRTLPRNTDDPGRLDRRFRPTRQCYPSTLATGCSPAVWGASGSVRDNLPLHEVPDAQCPACPPSSCPATSWRWALPAPFGAAGIPTILVRYRDDDLAQASRFVARSIRVPHPEENEPGFIRALERLGRTSRGARCFLPATRRWSRWRATRSG